MEAIIVTLILTGIILQLRQYFNKKLGAIKVVYINILASSIAAVYVVSQELKFHNLGGNNVYDPCDLLASCIGLIVTFGTIRLFGFMNEKKLTHENKSQKRKKYANKNHNYSIPFHDDVYSIRIFHQSNEGIQNDT